MNLFTIGFTLSSAEHFFERLKSAGVRRVADGRLNNASQLAGFAGARLLCAEAQPHHCHRRVVAELIATDSKTKLSVMHL
jgi:uncharacterized protein (DUF488 family)